MPDARLGPAISMEARLDRIDLVVFDTVEASSSTTTVLCGLIPISDGDDLKLFRIPFFTASDDQLIAASTGPTPATMSRP